MSKIMSVTSGGTNQIKLSYTPQMIGIKGSVNIQGSISRVTITREGSDTLLNLDGEGFQTVSSQTTIGDLVPNAAATVSFVMLADGWVDGPCTVQVTTTTGQTCDVYALSLQKGGMFIKTLIDTVVANQETRYNKFFRLGIGVGNLSSGDVINLEFQDGTTQLVTAEEITGLGYMIYNNSQETYLFNNQDQHYKAVRIQPTANVEVYVQKFLI
jgi:hypothetical protein